MSTLVRMTLFPIAKALRSFVDLVAPRIDTSKLTEAEQETWHEGVHAVKNLCEMFGIR